MSIFETNLEMDAETVDNIRKLREQCSLQPVKFTALDFYILDNAFLVSVR